MAAPVGAQQSEEKDVEVETVKGGMGEFSVFIGDRKVVDTSRLWYPAPSKVVAKIRSLLAEPAS